MLSDISLPSQRAAMSEARVQNGNSSTGFSSELRIYTGCRGFWPSAMEEQTKPGGTRGCFGSRGGRSEGGRCIVCASVRRRLGGSEFLLWVCVMCVGCGIWAGERDLLVWGVGRPGRMVTHLSECGRVYLGGGDFLVQDIQRKPCLSSESKEVPEPQWDGSNGC